MLGFVKLKKSAEKFVWVEPRIGYLIFSQLLFLHTVNLCLANILLLQTLTIRDKIQMTPTVIRARH